MRRRIIQQQGSDRIVRVGTNGKMSELSAAVGLSSLNSIDDFIQTNESNYRGYRQVLAERSGMLQGGYGVRRFPGLRYRDHQREPQFQGAAR